MDVSGHIAITSATRNKHARYPSRSDERFIDGMVFPALNPSFRLSTNKGIFTIGSCFARNIEEVLGEFTLPTRRFAVPPEEWPTRANGLLNEYNPGCIAQRIAWGVEGRDTRTLDGTLFGSEESTFDLLLPGGAPVTRERASQRRHEIDAIYKDLRSSGTVIITLGMTECWFDADVGVYLNRMPPPAALRDQRERYRFRQLFVADCIALLKSAFEILFAAEPEIKIILTVSPVPLQTTFVGDDCVIANNLSKSVLRVTAGEIAKAFPKKVDYFPSFEMVTFLGVHALEADNVHVRHEVVRRVVDYMKSHYVET